MSLKPLEHNTDGATDLEAVQSSQGADLFIGYGGVVERPAVAESAEWFVYDHDDLTRALKCSKVGSWISWQAAVVSRIAAFAFSIV